MPERYIYLVGADDVRTAAGEMSHAAESIRYAVSEFGEHVRKLERVLQEDREARAAERGGAMSDARKRAEEDALRSLLAEEPSRRCQCADPDHCAADEAPAPLPPEVREAKEALRVVLDAHRSQPPGEIGVAAIRLLSVLDAQGKEG